MQTIKNYQQARDFLGSKKERPFAHNTRIELDPLNLGHEVITVKYHGNPVVNMYPDGTNTYSSCGWKTITTKERINWFLPDGFRLHQEKSVWYIGRHYGDKLYTFADGIAIDSGGNVYNAAPDNEQAEIKAKIKAIKKYVDGFIKALLNGEIESPSGGDCWHCYFKNQDGETMGNGNPSHIVSHMEESYYVPSLLYNAIEKTGRASGFAKDGIQRLWNGENISEWQQSIIARDVKSCLTAYIKHEFGLAQ